MGFPKAEWLTKSSLPAFRSTDQSPPPHRFLCSHSPRPHPTTVRRHDQSKINCCEQTRRRKVSCTEALMQRAQRGRSGLSVLIIPKPLSNLDKGFSGCGFAMIAGLKVELGLERVDLVGGDGRDDVNEGVDDG